MKDGKLFAGKKSKGLIWITLSLAISLSVIYFWPTQYRVYFQMPETEVPDFLVWWSENYLDHEDSDNIEFKENYDERLIVLFSAPSRTALARMAQKFHREFLKLHAQIFHQQWQDKMDEVKATYEKYRVESMGQKRPAQLSQECQRLFNQQAELIYQAGDVLYTSHHSAQRVDQLLKLLNSKFQLPVCPDHLERKWVEGQWNEKIFQILYEFADRQKNFEPKFGKLMPMENWPDKINWAGGAIGGAMILYFLLFFL